jgi:ATP-dependent protease ClpP protease subunit
MMHQPHGSIGGTASDIKIQADSDRDRWFTAEQARE